MNVRNQTTQGDEVAGTEGVPHVEDSLSPDAILIAEFEYVAQTAFQANEDRARVATFYLVTLGSLIAAILTTQAESMQDRYLYWAFAVLFGVLTLASVLTLLQLARLRQAWFDSVSTMNEIKEFYIERIQQVQLQEAFRWRMSALPDRFKPWSLSSLLAIQVALLGGVTLGSAILFAGLSSECWLWEYAIAAGVIASALQIALYRWLLCK